MTRKTGVIALAVVVVIVIPALWLLRLIYAEEWSRFVMEPTMKSRAPIIQTELHKVFPDLENYSYHGPTEGILAHSEQSSGAGGDIVSYRQSGESLTASEVCLDMLDAMIENGWEVDQCLLSRYGQARFNAYKDMDGWRILAGIYVPENVRAEPVSIGTNLPGKNDDSQSGRGGFCPIRDIPQCRPSPGGGGSTVVEPTS